MNVIWYKMLPPYPKCNKIHAQLGASGTSVGTNYEEADGTITKEFNLAVSTVLNFKFGIYFELCFLNFGFYLVMAKNKIR